MGFKSYKSLGCQNFQNASARLRAMGAVVSTLGNKYNIISTDGLFLYYPFDAGSYTNTSVANYATGSSVYDTTIMGSTNANSDVLYTPTRANLNSLTTNKVILPCSTSPGLSYSLWFYTTSLSPSTYYFLFTLQDRLGYNSGGNRPR